MKTIKLRPLDPFGLKLMEDRNAGPDLLYTSWRSGEINDAQLRRWILMVWQAAEFPASLGHQAWLDMFNATGFVSDEMDEPPEMPVTVYRGAPLGRPRGFSWTWQLEQAEWFAGRLFNYSGKPVAVYQVTLPEDLLLAVLGGVEGRGEREVIVNPRRLPGRWTPKAVATTVKGPVV